MNKPLTILLKMLTLLVFSSCMSNKVELEELSIHGPDNAQYLYIQESNFTLEGHSTNSKGEIIVVGSKWRDKTNEDIFYGKIDGQGNLKWKYNPEGHGHDKATAIYTDKEDNHHIVGYKFFPSQQKEIMLNFVYDNGKTKTKKLHHLHNTVTEEPYQIYPFLDAFIITGFSKHNLNALMFKVSKSNKLLNQLNVGGKHKDYLFDVIATPEDSLLALGSYNSFHDISGNIFLHEKSKIYLVKTDENLGLLWEKQIEYPGHAIGHKILQNAADEYLIVGSCQTEENKNFQAMLIAIDAQGKKQWEKSMGGKSWDYAVDAIKTKDHIYLLSNSDNQKSTILLYKLDIHGNKLKTYKYSTNADLKAKSISIKESEIIIGAYVTEGNSTESLIIHQGLD